MTKQMRAFKERLRENESRAQAERQMEWDPDQVAACQQFFEELKELLDGKYVAMGSCNKDISRYLVPAGMEDQVTYYGKPDFSFRISDHWNWFSSLKKCSDVNYIQCDSVDMPKAWCRKNEGEATRPRRGLQVAIQGTDGKYHHVFGYKWDKKQKQFRWVENRPVDICKLYGLI